MSLSCRISAPNFGVSANLAWPALRTWKLSPYFQVSPLLASWAYSRELRCWPPSPARSRPPSASREQVTLFIPLLSFFETPSSWGRFVTCLSSPRQVTNLPHEDPYHNS